MSVTNSATQSSYTQKDKTNWNGNHAFKWTDKKCTEVLNIATIHLTPESVHLFQDYLCRLQGRGDVSAGQQRLQKSDNKKWRNLCVQSSVYPRLLDELPGQFWPPFRLQELV